MNRFFYSLCLLAIQFSLFSQTPTAPLGKTVTFSVNNFRAASANFTQPNGLIGNMTTKLPMPNGLLGDIILNETLISEKKIANVQTFDGKSPDGTIQLKLTLTANKIDGLMHTPEGYFIIEPFDIKQDLYLVYGMNEIPADRMKCGTQDETINAVNKNGRILSVAPFPVGTQLRTYQMAAAATGELTTFYTNQAGASAQIVSIMNASNLIYELEASIRFQLIAATTTSPYSLIFTNGATDPFTVDPSFANAANSQTGFTAMNNAAGGQPYSGILPYANYGVGHTFHTKADLGGGAYSISGQAGPTPCIDGSKARGWTEWTFNAALGAIVNVFVHEVGHQFSAPHTFNAVGGPSSGSTFCTGGWSSTSAVEPGSGSTLMGYHNNCTFPNYSLSGNNKLSYFHTKSLELMYTAVNGSSGTCATSTATGNTPPVANAGGNVTIPKGTPFKLTGTATDANSDAMSYTWEQFDVATTNDKGAFGSSILGTGGYYAVNSTTAPLFRSEMSTTVLDRTFPKLTHILNSGNAPADSEGEALPQVARSMKFRFTVRDNRANGGGVDSDLATVTVDNSGPFLLTSQNTATLWFYNGTNTATITWSVNGTTAAPLNVANVKISLSTDGGTTFPITLLASTANDGSETIIIPNNLTTQGRIKIEPVGTYAFFDINNVNITITNTCSPETTSIIPSTSVSAQAGNSALNLGLSALGAVIPTVSGTIDTGDTPSNLTYINPSNVCNGPSNSNYVETRTFVAGTTGSYTFTVTSAAFSFVINLYATSFISNSVCTNFLNSNAQKLVVGGSVTINGSFTQTLTAGQQYVLVSQGFNASALGAYTVTITPPGGGGIYAVAPAVGSPYAYTYLVVNSAGNIVAFNNTSDLTNAATYSADTYTVYGFSYQGGAVLSNYVGTSLSSFQALLTANTVCGKLSTNTKTVTITCTTPTVAAITGTTTVCTGSTTTLANTTPSGVWSSSAPSIAPVSASGVVTGSAAGTATITYSVNIAGCTGTATALVTVNAVPPTPTAQANTTILLSTSITLTATGCTGTLKWYKVSDNSLTTMPVSPTTTTAYYAKCEQTTNSVTCAGASSANVTVTVEAAIFSIATGNWESNGTWNLGRVPLNTDVVVIDLNHQVTINTNNANAKRVQYNGTGKVIFSSTVGKLNVGM